MFRETQNKKIASCCCSRARAGMKGEEEKGKKGRYKWEKEEGVWSIGQAGR